MTQEQLIFNMWKAQLKLNDIYLSDKVLMQFIKNNITNETKKDVTNLKDTKNLIKFAIENITDKRFILQFIESQNKYQEDEENEKTNCNICGDILVSHIYGNVCGRHIPSYALW